MDDVRVSHRIGAQVAHARVAGDLVPIDSFQTAAAWAASAYPADVWLSLSTREQSTAIYLEMRKLDEAYAALSSIGEPS